MRVSNFSDLTRKILLFWISGRLLEVVAHGGLTVCDCLFFLTSFVRCGALRI